MGNEFKILFYIIIGVIYIISKLYNKEKKKQNQREVNKKPIDSQSVEDIFRELKKSLQLPNEPEYTTNEPTPTTYETGMKREKVVKEKMILVRESSKIKKIKKTNNNIPSISETEVGKQKIVYEENEIAANFDARKAVIYSEILKRPQY
jgi:hypothetical protein